MSQICTAPGPPVLATRGRAERRRCARLPLGGRPRSAIRATCWSVWTRAPVTAWLAA